jgi:hypothetical protein
MNSPNTSRGGQVADLPIGTGASGTRMESDSMGTIEVPAEHYWGAQTQRSLIHFSIGDDHMPLAVYRATGTSRRRQPSSTRDPARQSIGQSMQQASFRYLLLLAGIWGC